MIVGQAELSVMEFVSGSAAFNGLKSCAKASIAERKHMRGSGVHHSGEGADSFCDLLIEARDVRITLVADTRERQRYFNAMIDVKAQRHVAKRLKAADDQNRPGEQHYGAGNFCDGQRFAHLAAFHI